MQEHSPLRVLPTPGLSADTSMRFCNALNPSVSCSEAKTTQTLIFSLFPNVLRAVHSELGKAAVTWSLNTYLETPALPGSGRALSPALL